MTADGNQLTEPWPGYATKAEVHAWYSTASDGEKEAVNRVYRDYHAWQRDPANGWFGVDINPDRIQGVVRALAYQYNAPLKYCTYNILPK